MSFVVLLTCAHAAVILSAEDVQGKLPPSDRPWILFPMPDGDSIDPGDGMSCITCLTPQTVAGIYATDKVQFTSDGRLVIPVSIIPDGMPNLISGAGDSPADGACVMQAAAWLASNGSEWTDTPSCVHPVLRKVAIWVNDSVGTKTRQELWPLIPRLIETNTGDRKANIRTGVALAVWAAERVLPLIKNPVDGELAAERLGKARAWLDNAAAAASAAAYADAASAASDAAYAASAAASAAYAADAASAAAYAAYAAADAASAAAAADAAYAYAYAADAASAAAYAASAASAAASAASAAAYAAYAAAAYAAYAADAASDAARIKFLTDLIDEYDRVTGRTGLTVITAETWEDFRRVLGAEC